MKTSIKTLAAAALAACAGLALATPVAVTGDHHTFDTAFALPASAFDLGVDPDIDFSTTIPHASLVDAAAGPFDYYRLQLTAGSSLTLDIDYSDGWDHAGLALDTKIGLWSADGTLLAVDDDDPRPWGFPGPSADSGSFDITDPYLQLGGLAAGSYVIGVAYSGANALAGGWATGGEIPAGGMYALNVSVASVPEPAAAWLCFAGLLPLLGGLSRRRRR
jgi:hypothetical protein